MSDPVELCALCPRLCRPSCPVAVGSAREAAVPAVIAEVLLAWRRGAVPDSLAREAATLCVDCGACQDHCHLHVPLPAALREARARLLPEPEVAPLGEVEGDGAWVAIEGDERRWAEALGHRLGRPVARLRTRDGLGVALRGRPRAVDQAEALRRRLTGRTAVVADGDAATVLGDAGLTFQWLHAVVPGLAEGAAGCAAPGGPGCCGGAGPLRAHHPETARRLALGWAGRDAVVDARCARWLRETGQAVQDAVDRLLAGGGA